VFHLVYNVICNVSCSPKKHQLLKAIYDLEVKGENFDVAPAASAPTLLYSRSKIFKGVKGNIRSDILFSSDSLQRKL
jgi:hypothetical protein